MAIYYVTTAGSDSNSGTEANPFLTISKAWDTSSTGDTIIVNDSGTYTVVEGGANQLTTASGKLKTGLTIKAGEGCSPILDGGGTATYAFKCWNSWTVQGLTFRNFDDGTTNGTGAVVKQYYSHNDGFVYDCVFHDITGAAVDLQKTGTRVERNKIYNLWCHAAITVGLGTDNHVKNNIIYNTSGRAIYGTQATVEHNTVYNSPRQNHYQTNDSYRLYSVYAKYLRYNIVEAANVRIAAVRANNGESRYNCVTGTYDASELGTPDNYYNNTLGTGDIELSPQFTDKDNANFVLPTGSPCIQAAHTSSTPLDQQKFSRNWNYDEKIFGHNTQQNPEMGALEKHPARIMGVDTFVVSKVLGASG